MTASIFPRLSIVVPSYNSAPYLPQTLKSLIEQASDGIEIIVVDDGSTDNTEQVVQPFLGQCVRYIRIENSGGPAKPRNIGIQAARAPFIGFFDSDDVAISREIQRSMRVIENNPNAGLLCTNFHITDTNLEVIRLRVNDQNQKLMSVLDNRLSDLDWLIGSRSAFKLLLQTNFVGVPSVIVRKDVFGQVGYFDESLRNIDDRDMWLRISRRFDVIYRNVPTFLYRQHDEGISKQRLGEQAAERAYVGEKLLAGTEKREETAMIKDWIAFNYLDLGYHSFHRNNDRKLALSAFTKSFRARPSSAAFRGALKSIMPPPAYSYLKSFIKH